MPALLFKGCVMFLMAMWTAVCLTQGSRQGGSAWGILYEVNTRLVVRTQREALGTDVSHDVISNHMCRVAGLNYTQSPTNVRRYGEFAIFFFKSYFKLCVCVPVCGRVPMEPGGIRSPGLK